MEERIRQIGVCCKSHLLDQAAKVMPGQNIINIHKNKKMLVNLIDYSWPEDFLQQAVV